MKILVVKSSPHKNGSSNFLADQFIKGAKEKGHDIVVFDAGHSKINPYVDENTCKEDGLTVPHDDIDAFQETLLRSDMIVFVTPLYYFDMSAQLKMVIDRCFNLNAKIAEKNLKASLITVSLKDDDWTFDCIKKHYLTICRHINLENKGMILGTACSSLHATMSSVYPQNAYELGKSL